MIGLLVVAAVLGVFGAVVWMMDPSEREGLMEKLSTKLRQEEVDAEEDAMIERLEQMRPMRAKRR